MAKRFILKDLHISLTKQQFYAIVCCQSILFIHWRALSSFAVFKLSTPKEDWGFPPVKPRHVLSVRITGDVCHTKGGCHGLQAYWRSS